MFDLPDLGSGGYTSVRSPGHVFLFVPPVSRGTARAPHSRTRL